MAETPRIQAHDRAPIWQIVKLFLYIEFPFPRSKTAPTYVQLSITSPRYEELVFLTQPTCQQK
jgi:hypothetical protein